MRRRRAGWAALLTLALGAGGAGAQEAPAAPEPDPQVVAMGTGSVAGVYFPVGVALCRLANQHRRETNLRCAARPTPGSIANLEGLRTGSLALGIVQSDVQAAAVAGSGAFAGTPYPELRAVMALYPELLTVVVRPDAGVGRIEDLAGKRVAIGAPGSGTRAIGDALIAALGWTPASFAETPDIPPERLARALCAGEIDGFFYAIGHPAALIQEATTECDARLVDAAGPAVDELVRDTPSFVAAAIPAGLYRGADRPVATFGVSATLVTRADLPEDTVYALVSGMLGELPMLRALDPVLAGLDPKAMVTEGLTAPLHPGAERYFREQGWID